MVSLSNISALSSSSGPLHERAVSLVRAVRSSELALAEVLGAMSVSGEFRRYASSIGDYAQLIGLGRGKGRQLTVIGRALPDLPRLHHVMRDGGLAWTAAFEVARVAVAETEAGWIELAEAWPVRELRAVVGASCKGDPAPSVEERPSAGITALTFELLAEDAQLVSRAMALLRSRACAENSGDSAPVAPMSNEEVLVAMARIVVSSEAPAAGVSAERFTTVIRECPRCESSTLGGLADGALAEVSESTRAMARCDSSVIDLRDGSSEIGRRHSTVSPRVRRLVFERDNYRCANPGCSNHLHLDVHHVMHRATGGGNELSNLLVLCPGCHRRTHDGFLQIDRLVEGFRFRLTPGGGL